MPKLFISYRRKSSDFMYRVAERLTALLDAEVFYDFTGMDSNDFESSLLKNLRDSDVVLLIVTEHTFDPARIHRDDDWVRREIAEALHLDKSIVLVLYEGLIPPADLPEDIREIRKKHGLAFYREPWLFEPSIQALVEFLCRSTIICRQLQPSITSIAEVTVLESAPSLRDQFYAALDEMEAAPDKALFVLEKVRDEGYRPPQTLDLDALIEDTRAEVLERQRQQEAVMEYEEIREWVRRPASRKHGLKALDTWQKNYASYINELDKENLISLLALTPIEVLGWETNRDQSVTTIPKVNTVTPFLKGGRRINRLKIGLIASVGLAVLALSILILQNGGLQFLSNRPEERITETRIAEPAIIVDQNYAAEHWTDTPTPNITASVDAFNTLQVQATEQVRSTIAAIDTRPASIVADDGTQTQSEIVTQVMGTIAAIDAQTAFTMDDDYTLRQSEIVTQVMNTIAAIDTQTAFTTADNGTQTQSELAAQVIGTIAAIDTRTASIVADDGTQLAMLSPTSMPDPLQAAYDQAAAYNYHDGNNSWIPVTQAFDGVTMMLVPPGCFMMGNETGNEDEKPMSEQCLDAPFWIDQTEVTQEQLHNLVFVPETASSFTGDNHPVEQITWFEARDFCEQRGARLPTEREWEYAARGPEGWIYPWGDEWNEDNAIWSGNSANQTSEVGNRTAGSSWVGALDMSGNVWEWVSSLYLPYESSDSREANTGERTDVQRVLRGGSWDSDYLVYLRTSFRYWYNPDDRLGNLGFRCVRTS